MISAIVLTKNEQSEIPRLVRQLAFCSEILIIDDYSQDRTIKTAAELGCKVFQRKLDNNFAAQRNFGLRKAKYDWVLYVDADEHISRDLKKEIVDSVNDIYDAFFIPRRDVFRERKLQYGTWSDSHIRLARKSVGVWKRKVHEAWEIDGKIGTIKHEIIHYAHNSVYDFWNDIRIYSKLHTIENIREGKRSTLFKVIVWPLGKFFIAYFVKRGYKDGIQGLLYAGMMSAHSFISWSRLYLDDTKINN